MNTADIGGVSKNIVSKGTPPHETHTTAQANAVLSALEANDSEARLFTDYSGKFMYGATCLAFAASNAIEVCIAFMNAGLDDGWFEEANYLLGLRREDDLGLGVVVYFPGIKIAD